jgi:hypothetical protein
VGPHVMSAHIGEIPAVLESSQKSRYYNDACKYDSTCVPRLMVHMQL